MDKNKLKQLVEGVAEIKERRPLKGSNPRALSIEIVTEVDELTGEEVEFTRQIPDRNETLGYEIVKLKAVPKLCELGCGDMVCNQVVERRFAETPKPHWKTRCRTCGCFLTPDGEGLVNNSHAIQHLYYQHLSQGVVRRVVPVKQISHSGQITVHEQNQRTRKNNWLLGQDGQITYQDPTASKE